MLRTRSVARETGTRSTVYLPNVGGGKAGPKATSGMPWQAERLAELWLADSRREHYSMGISPLLVEAAEIRVNTMIREDHFSHQSRENVWPNRVVRSVGYPLPVWWWDNDNQVESIAAGWQTAEEVLEQVWGSLLHRNHLFGLVESYRQHKSYGFWYDEVRDGSTKYSTYWCMLTAP